MFTGIIQTQGKVLSLSPTSDQSYQLELEAHFQDEKVILGESIAVNGVCLTVTQIKNAVYSFDLAPETVARTSLSHLNVPGASGGQRRVNLERSLRIGDRMSGHWVQGHVDGVAILSKIVVLPGGNYELTFAVQAPELLKYCVKKGSITVDGISLTIHEIQQNELKFQIIPHTWAETNLSDLSPGEKVNIEVDILAKYLERLSENKK